MTVKFVKTRKPNEDLVLTPDMRKIRAEIRLNDGAMHQVDLLKDTGMEVATFYRTLLELTNNYYIFAYVGAGGTVLVDHQIDPGLTSDRKLADEWEIEL